MEVIILITFVLGVSLLIWTLQQNTQRFKVPERSSSPDRPRKLPGEVELQQLSADEREALQIALRRRPPALPGEIAPEVRLDPSGLASSHATMQVSAQLPSHATSPELQIEAHEGRGLLCVLPDHEVGLTSTPGVLRCERLKVSSDWRALARSCLRHEVLLEHPAPRGVAWTSVKLEATRLEATVCVHNYSVDRDQRLEAAERVLDWVFTLHERVAWRDQELPSMLVKLLVQPGIEAQTRRKLLGQLARLPEEHPARRELEEELFAPAHHELREHVLTQAAGLLLGLLDPDRIVGLLNIEMMRPRRARNDRLLQQLLERVTPRMVLHPELLPAARQRVLGRLFNRGDEGDMGAMLSQLLGRLDGGELIELLDMLGMRNKADAARALCALAANPRRVDTSEERRALLRALISNREHIPRGVPEVEAFLYACLRGSQYEAVLEPAIQAIGHFGGEVSVRRLMELAAQPDELAQPTLAPRLERAARRIKDQLGERSQGALSLAEDQGQSGQLSVARGEAGGLSMSPEDGRG